jgi:hypothetical protein
MTVINQYSINIETDTDHKISNGERKDREIADKSLRLREMLRK